MDQMHLPLPYFQCKVPLPYHRVAPPTALQKQPLYRPGRHFKDRYVRNRIKLNKQNK